MHSQWIWVFLVHPTYYYWHFVAKPWIWFEILNYLEQALRFIIRWRAVRMTAKYPSRLDRSWKKSSRGPISRLDVVSGMLKKSLLVSGHGTLTERLFIIRASGGRNVGFEKATEDAIRKWRYRPATKDGVKVRMWVTIRVPFHFE